MGKVHSPQTWFTSLGLMLGATVLVTGVLTGCASTPSPVGEWGSSEQGQPHLTLSQSGEVSGTDGCNLLGGKWTLAGSTITFSQMLSTKMYCEGVDDWLSAVATAEIKNDTLIVKNVSGVDIGTLTKSGN